MAQEAELDDAGFRRQWYDGREGSSPYPGHRCFKIPNQAGFAFAPSFAGLIRIRMWPPSIFSTS